MTFRSTTTVYNCVQRTSELEVGGECLCLDRHARTHAQTNGQPRNIMLPAPYIGWAETKKKRASEERGNGNEE